MSIEKLLEQLNNRKLVIYGTGFVAGMLVEALRGRGLDGNIAAFAVSDDGDSEKVFRDLPVMSFDDVTLDTGLSDAIILIAVHTAVAGEIVPVVEGSGMDHILIYPYLTDLLYGSPVDSDAVIDTADIILRQDPSYLWLAVRHLVIEKGSAADTIYTKAISMHASEETAAKRLHSFKDLCESVERDGYRQDSKIMIDEDGRIIDGLHRITLAAYLGIKKLPAIIYPASEMFDRVIGKANRMDEDQLREGGMTEEEILQIKESQEKLLSKAEKMIVPAVSVIIPAYNVEGYIDECMRSVTEQTFEDMEILLINDGSSDGTPVKCEEWASRDERIIYISTENLGVAQARNIGIQTARGKYLAFVDPDDKLDLTYLEKLFEAAEREEADFSECDIMRWDGRTGKMIHRSSGQAFGVPYTKEEHMIYGPTASYKSISKRSIWIDNDILFPPCSFESPAVYALIVALSEKIVNVPEALYYYRRFREGSLIETAYAGKDGKPDPELGMEAMRSLIGEAKRLGLYDGNEELFERVVKYRLNDILAMQYHRRSEEEFRIMTDGFRSLAEELFPGGTGGSYAVWGGYNLNRILLHLPMLQDPDLRMNFSSVASVMLGPKNGKAPVHRNKYRQMMLEREWDVSFFSKLKEKRPEWLFMDMTEERSALIVDDSGSGTFVTMSDAFAGSDIGREMSAAGALDGAIIPGEDRLHIMQEAIPCFIKKVKDAAPGIKICVIENLLAEKKGSIDHSTLHDDIETIRKVNSELEKYYGILKECCPDAEFVEAYSCSPYITDEKYEYGALPSHLNAVVNRRIAEKAWKAIRDDG